jgi:hypothetical protein
MTSQTQFLFQVKSGTSVSSVGDSTLSSRSERWCLENWSLSLFVNVIRAVLRKHTPIAEETQVDRLQVRTSCVADVLRVGIQVV